MKRVRLLLSFFQTPEDYYRVTVYNEAIYLIVACLAHRFDQPGYRMYSTLEQLLLKACRIECHEEEMITVSKHYSADINMADLKTQFQTLSTNIEGDVSLGSLMKFLRDVPKAGRTLYSEVITLIKLS